MFAYQTWRAQFATSFPTTVFAYNARVANHAVISCKIVGTKTVLRANLAAFYCKIVDTEIIRRANPATFMATVVWAQDVGGTDFALPTTRAVFACTTRRADWALS